ncbi:glycoside hydrolase family 88 protein [Ferruginibacter albus]|nr:glycoside hydrolase family 88 protein [Ferruginibacter albus]
MLCLLAGNSIAQTKTIQSPVPLSEQLAKTTMSIWKDSMAFKKDRPAEWSYEQGVVYKGLEDVWKKTGNGDYFKYIQKNIDFFVRKDGSIRTYKLDDYNLDNICPGRGILTLYNTLSDNNKYFRAITLLKEQLNYQPKTSEGGYWHKQRYPSQMWLDGVYMAEPFHAEYAKRFNNPQIFEEIAKQFFLIEEHARDKKTGLYYHGWDESRKERWADPQTGLSANFWGRSVGWYAMALVDVLDYFPKDNPNYDSLVHIVKNLAVAIVKVQDPKTGLWWQVLNKPNEKDNYLESSASCMFVYALAKAVRKGYISQSYYMQALKGYTGIKSNFISVDSTTGLINLTKVCAVAGLGGKPYRDGSYDYYINEPVVSNDPKGLGAAMMMATEVESISQSGIGRNKNVLLDSYYNNEKKTDEATGQTISWHYKWDETPNSGFSFLGGIFNSYGATTSTLYEAPTAANLKNADIYIIVDPDIPKENPNTKYIEPGDTTAIINWVKGGGVLVILLNDTGNAEFDHTNALTKSFGIQFNKDSRNHVDANKFEMGKITGQPPLFRKAKNLYLKEISTLTVKAPAMALLKDNNDIIMASAKIGKGTVFAVGDPWLYNEYVDGRKLPAEYQNFTAAQELAQWLLRQVPFKINSLLKQGSLIKNK